MSYPPTFKKSVSNIYEEARNYLISPKIPPEKHAASEEVLLQIIKELGPVVESYPSWHPLVSNHASGTHETKPGIKTGYQGMDHTRYFVNGFITCPYSEKERELVIDSASNIDNSFAYITAEEINTPFYSSAVNPVLVKCVWDRNYSSSENYVPQHLAMMLMLEHELPFWLEAKCHETWDSVSPYMLGTPHKVRSSLFVNQKTAGLMRSVFESIFI